MMCLMLLSSCSPKKEKQSKNLHIAMNKNILRVISASRRVEMVGCYPKKLIEILKKRCPPEKVHSIVLWSKDPRNLIENTELSDCLNRYSQLFLHLTVSGMGGSCLEKGIPGSSEIFQILPELIRFTGDPGRVRLRFDPLVHLKFPDGRSYTNLDRFIKVAEEAKKEKIKYITVSWMEAYPKVVKRLKKYGIEVEQVSAEKRKEEADWILKMAKKRGISILGCCAPNLPIGRCIDGGLLTELHPGKLSASIKMALGQRSLCRCTESWDIGWYYPCPGSCLYCYANPVEPATHFFKKQ